MELIKAKDWQHLQLVIFEAPTQHVMQFESRMQFIKSRIPPNNPHVSAVSYAQCTGLDHLETMKRAAKSGLVLRKPQSHYYEDNSLFHIKVHHLVIGRSYWRSIARL
jgi:hypothetical protein